MKIFLHKILKSMLLYSLFINYLYSKNSDLKCSYIKSPNTLYVNQIFSLKLQCNILINDIVNIKNQDIHYKKSVNFKYYKNEIVWAVDKKYKNIFTTNIYLKALSKNVYIPATLIDLFLENGDKISTKIAPITISADKIKKEKGYSNIIAKELNIVKHRFNKYNNKYNLILMHIEGLYVNVDDFKIDDSSIFKQEIRNINRKLPQSDFIAAIVIPKTSKIFEFSYFNLEKNSFDTKKITIEFENDFTIENKTINPKIQNGYKFYILIILIILFFWLYYIRRKYIYIIIFFMISIYFLYYTVLSKEKGVVLKNSDIRILATKNSRISKKIDKNIKITILNRQNGYYQILFKDQSVGWTEVENVIKN